jgi:hypothetical protein
MLLTKASSIELRYKLCFSSVHGVSDLVGSSQTCEYIIKQINKTDYNAMKRDSILPSWHIVGFGDKFFVEAGCLLRLP